MKIRTSTWYHNSISVERGPLVFALRIEEEYRELRRNGSCSDWEIHPASPWNYALLLDPDHPEESFDLQRRELEHQPFDSLRPPILLTAKGRRVSEWQMKNNSAGELPLSPVSSTEKVEDVVLIPYGAAKLRIAEFPFLRQ